MPKLPGGPPALLAFRAGARAARAIPARRVPAAELLAARVAVHAMPARRRQVERNVTRIFGPGLAAPARREVVRDTFASYARYWIESFRRPGTPVEALESGTEARGIDHLDDALAAGHGVVVALPHLGGWEWAAFWLSACHGLPVTAVVEPLEPPELASWFVGLREQLGMQLVPLGPGALGACARALKENRVLCLVCDRDLQGDGVEVELLGETTTLPSGPALLALRSGAPLVTATTAYAGRGHRLVVDPPLDTARRGALRDDVRRVTGELAGRLEAIVRSAPEQWHLMQPNWPSDRAAS